MSLIGPHLKLKDLKAGAEATIKGEGLAVPLPGVAADAYQMDKRAHGNNRELIKKIQKAVVEAKPDTCDKGVSRFVWAFRMYPNGDSSYWDEARKIGAKAASDAAEATHRCGCGCSCAGDSCPTPAAAASARKRTEKKRSAPLGRRKK